MPLSRHVLCLNVGACTSPSCNLELLHDSLLWRRCWDQVNYHLQASSDTYLQQRPRHHFFCRSGRAKGTSFKDIQKEMEIFKKTGKHPELEAQQQAASTVVPALPDVDVHRPHVFMDLQQSRNKLGARTAELLVM